MMNLDQNMRTLAYFKSPWFIESTFVGDDLNVYKVQCFEEFEKREFKIEFSIAIDDSTCNRPYISKIHKRNFIMDDLPKWISYC